MSLENKCKLYFMLYQRLLSMTTDRRRSHQIAFKRTNYILEAIGEKLSVDELKSIAKQ